MNQEATVNFEEVVTGDIILLNARDFGLGNVELGFGVSGIFGEDGEGRHYDVMHNGVQYGLYARNKQEVVRWIPA